MDVPAPSTSRLLLSPGPVSPAAASHIRTALSKVDEFWGDEAAIVQARAAKRSAASKQASEETERGHTRACSACRKGKIRCLSTSPLETTHRLLRDIRRELEAALAEKPVIDPLEDGSDEEDELRHDDRSTSDEVQLLRNPLAILAEQACEASSPISPGSAAGGAPVGERYYEASLYLSRPESNFALDPVTAGILNLEELDRLIRL
ncbi:RemN protein [Rhodotorula toruloides ATCC 204091]|uniref:BY PROTMAP: gi/342319158/gb/EGU11108.1/ RemN protein [Rhodotorula glutinis ATCC 204091] n=1 Tax=Rhodotorula toruloides TaxID=5286 RepID=A0A0K3CMA0_RHOTO|nr:RemN protein [Rhodotorula toruloides ATCC 204091]KAK4329687.1 RemN protein [Rhodotorula toruloides]